MKRVGVRLNEAGALRRRIDVLEQQQVRRREAIDKAMAAMEAHFDRRRLEIENLRARLAALPDRPLRIAQ